MGLFLEAKQTVYLRFKTGLRFETTPPLSVGDWTVYQKLPGHFSLACKAQHHQHTSENQLLDMNPVDNWFTMKIAENGALWNSYVYFQKVRIHFIAHSTWLAPF